jgi:hypothetical protein
LKQERLFGRHAKIEHRMKGHQRTEIIEGITEQICGRRRHLGTKGRTEGRSGNKKDIREFFKGKTIFGLNVNR